MPYLPSPVPEIKLDTGILSNSFVTEKIQRN